MPSSAAGWRTALSAPSLARCEGQGGAGVVVRAQARFDRHDHDIALVPEVDLENSPQPRAVAALQRLENLAVLGDRLVPALLGHVGEVPCAPDACIECAIARLQHGIARRST